LFFCVRHKSTSRVFCFSIFYLQPYLNAQQNVALPLLIAGQKKKAAYKRASELLETVGLKDRISHIPQQLSGGEMQRVAIARALANEPNLILADEPTGNLDKANAEIVLETFQQITKSGVSLVVITHDPTIAPHFDRVIYLDKGQLKK